MPFEKFKRLLIGTPLPTHKEQDEKLNVPLGLAVFSSDALSSTAYATDEILIALAGTAFLASGNPMPIHVAIAIIILIAIVVISYRQVIKAYPVGGGAYVVSKANLGVLPSQLAASSIWIDYILTVSVSISAGVAAITSTGVVPHRYTVPLCLLFNILIMLINLRGMRESGRAIAIPAFGFLLIMYSLVISGLYQYGMDGLGILLNGVTGTGASTAPNSPPVGAGTFGDMAYLLLFLKAFSHGCAGLTGIEAVSIGVGAFKEPASKRAITTMGLMGLFLATIFLGVTFVAFALHIQPVAHETVLSQVARAVFGAQSVGYYAVQISTMVVLVLAANTAFAGFPRISNMLADDGFLPRQLMHIGDRLVHSNGIIILGIISSFLIIVYHGDTHALIPLYAVGVFTSFTLSQLGMVAHHRRYKENGWRRGMVITGIGGTVTGVVTILLMVEKFTEGAWIILVTVPTLILTFREIKRHYLSIGKQLGLPDNHEYCPIPIQHTVLVLVSSLNRGTIPALEYAKTIAGHVEAVHVELNPAATERLKRNWDKWGCGVTLTVLPSPYRSIVQPVLDYIEEVDKRFGDKDVVTVVIPEFVTKKFWHNILHNQTSLVLKTHLMYRKNKVVTTIRYHLDE